MKAYSPDVRERILRAVDQGYQRADIIKGFGVSRATIKRYLKQRRETGEVKAKPHPGRPPRNVLLCKPASSRNWRPMMM
jgi:transposase